MPQPAQQFGRPVKLSVPSRGGTHQQRLRMCRGSRGDRTQIDHRCSIRLGRIIPGQDHEMATTLKQQGREGMEFLLELNKAHREGRQFPSLIPVSG
jgi:hypothetical protein